MHHRPDAVSCVESINVKRGKLMNSSIATEGGAIRPAALITGASSGIGRELAGQFAAGGHDLILVARSVDRLKQIASDLHRQFSVRAEVIAIDLAVPAAAQQLVDLVQQRNLDIAWLVNNAGFGAVGDVAALTLERQSSMVQVNVTALTELTRLALPLLRERGKGGILNVASTAAFQPGPGMAVYYASKAFVLSFSEALHEELRGSPIHVCCLCPGPTVTAFGQDSGMDQSVLFRMGAMDAATVARAGYEGLMRGSAIVIPGLKNKFGAWSVRWVPRFMVRRLVRRLNSAGSNKA
jgi:short-subunit dehydrogenase